MKNNIFNIDDSDDLPELDANKSISLDTIKSNIVNYDSKKLCQIIVSNRYLNMNKELAVLAMQELSIRRQNGDQFNFEEFIEESLNQLPELNFSMPDLRVLLNKLSGK